ncbi:MAG: hypothetical protein RL885_22085 [Planctomycetota bacterium]
MSIRVVLVALLLAASGEAQTESVILITLDGARTQEIFGGADLELLKARAGSEAVEKTDLYRRFWAESARERRLKLMPFFWGELMVRHGSIAGNAELGSRVLLSNGHRFSYPGYSEILTGVARDDVIDSNAKRQNPHPTVLEVLRTELGVQRSRVACFASWEVFDWIVEKEKGTITCNSGYEPYPNPSPVVQTLSTQQFETPTPWDSVRHDLYTFRFALAHLASFSPRVLYLALGETDDWAHDGRYDRVLTALQRTDRYLETLWRFLESDERYQGKTTWIVTTDHGRGNTIRDWTDHGADVEGAQNVWIAFASPEMALRGEWTDAPTLYSSQIAATMCQLLGVDYSKHEPEAGAPIEVGR